MLVRPHAQNTSNDELASKSHSYNQAIAQNKVYDSTHSLFKTLFFFSKVKGGCDCQAFRMQEGTVEKN